ILVVVVALPVAGMGRCSRTDWLPWTTLARSISTPGKDTLGGSVTFIVAATVAKDGRTLGAESSTYSSPAVSMGSAAAPTPMAESVSSEAVQESSCGGSSAPCAVSRSTGMSVGRLLGGGGIGQDVLDGEVAEHHGRADGGARAGVGVPHDRRGGVAGGVEPLDHGAVLAEYAAPDVGVDAALGAEVSGDHLDRVERRLGDRPEARVGLVRRVAVVVVVPGGAAVEVLVAAVRREAVEPVGGLLQRLGRHVDELGELGEGVRLVEVLRLEPLAGQWLLGLQAG